MAKCLVLGANGFIGSHLVDSLAAAGHKVRCFDRFADGQKPMFDSSDRTELYRGDFLNAADLEESLQGMDYVFHFISTTTPITAENDPLIDIETNIKMSVRLFALCAEANVKKVIFASTGGAIYGLGSGQPIAEDTLPQPISPYAIGKLSIEHYLHYFRRRFGLDSVVFRISNPYGERQSLRSKQGVIPIFLQRIHNDEAITVLGDGSMIRDYIYVKDVARMIAGSFKKTKQHVYNLGSGQGFEVNQLVAAMEVIVGHKIKQEHKPVPVTFVDRVVLDTTRFQNEFNIPAETTLQEGIQKTWEYIQRYEE